MKNNGFIGELVSIKYRDRKALVYGVVIDFSDDWMLMHYNPDQFRIDGYIIVSNNNIQKAQINENEKFKKKVLKLKKQFPEHILNMPLTDLKSILDFIGNKFGLFQFDTKSEKASYVGKLISLNTKNLIIDYLDTKAQWKGAIKFRPGDVRTIEFNTDYLNSLSLIASKKKRK